MKPHHYFWISIYAILFWLVKLFFIELLPFEWWKELLIIDLISFIFIAIAFGDDEPNKRSVSRQIDLTFCIFTNVFGVLFWGIEESLKI